MIADSSKHYVALTGCVRDPVSNVARPHHIGFTTDSALSSKPEVVDLIAQCVAEVNAELAQVETVKRFALLPKELDQEDGEVTATQKVKRRAIESEFSDMIERLYR